MIKSINQLIADSENLNDSFRESFKKLVTGECPQCHSGAFDGYVCGSCGYNAFASNKSLVVIK